MKPRKQYALTLQTRTDTELLAEQQRTLDQYEAAKREGHCVMTAVLYFDLQQVIDEMNRRNELHENQNAN